MTIAVAVLLVSVLSTTGLLALGAAASRRHWFVRTAAFLAALSPLLLVPAYEPFIALTLQGAVVAGGVWMARAVSRKRRQRSAEEMQANRPWGFSLSSLLLAMVVCGFGAAVLSQAPRLNHYAWQSVALIGGVAGVVTLLGYFAARYARGWKLLVGVLIGLGLTGAISPILAWFDWFLPSVHHGSWPPPLPDAADSIDVLYGYSERPTLLWFVILGALCLTTLLLAWLLALMMTAKSRQQRGRQRLSAVLAATLSLAIAAPAAAMLYLMLTPQAPPRSRLPNPNGWDVLVTAGRSIEQAAINSPSFDRGSAGSKQLSDAVGEVGPAVQRVREGLNMQVLSRVDYTFGGEHLPLDEIQSLRSLARALSAEAGLAVSKGNIEQASDAALTTIELGYAARNGGLWIEALVGAAITGVGAADVFRMHLQLDRSQALSAIKRIQSAQARVEPQDAFKHRDYVWSLYAYGWYGRLNAILLRTMGEEFDGSSAMALEEARMRLLIGHLWLHAYAVEHSQAPETWSHVEAAGFPGLPIDPFSPSGGALRYVRRGDAYHLYSVGLNGVDDGGAAPPVGDYPTHSTQGDFSLEMLYGAPSPAAAN